MNRQLKIFRCLTALVLVIPFSILNIPTNINILGGIPSRSNTKGKSQLAAARSFENWSSNLSNLCESGGDSVEALDEGTNKKGLLFLKTFKTASSTAVGVHLRISRNIATRLNKTFQFCDTKFTHGAAKDKFPNRDRDHSFLWTILRDPTARLTSHFYFKQVSRLRKDPSIENMREYALSSAKDRYLTELSTSGYQPGVNRPTKVTALNTIQSIIDEYDFIAITERFDESLVVLKLLLDLKIEDILYLRAKNSGGYDAGGKNGTCTLIEPAMLTDEMKKFLKSDEWTDASKFDQLLYDTAVRSLDLTIERLGRLRVKKELERFKRLNQAAVLRCHNTAIFPCSSDGNFTNRTNCIWRDAGCSFPCIDKFVRASIV